MMPYVCGWSLPETRGCRKFDGLLLAAEPLALGGSMFRYRPKQ